MLQKRGWPNCGMCKLCNQVQETASHLLFKYRFTIQIWSKVKSWLGLNEHKWLVSISLRQRVVDGGGAQAPWAEPRPGQPGPWPGTQQIFRPPTYWILELAPDYGSVVGNEPLCIHVEQARRLSPLGLCGWTCAPQCTSPVHHLRPGSLPHRSAHSQDCVLLYSS
jgi:hypothetical protein